MIRHQRARLPLWPSKLVVPIAFGVLVLRLILRIVLGAPPPPPDLAPAARRASAAVHGLLCVLLLAMPVLGWAATAAGGFPVEFFNAKLPGLIAKDKDLSETLFGLHGMDGWTILALVSMHIAAALGHWLIKRDGIMRRMNLF